MNQLDLFELIEMEVQAEKQKKQDNINFEIGENVKVKRIKQDSLQDIEDYYYIKEFENKKGVITEKKLNKTNLYCYKVNFSRDKFGYFYDTDLVLV